MRMNIEARIVNPLLGTRFPLPSYATDGSAAMDLRACVEAEVQIAPRGQALIPTGMALNMQNAAMVAIVASRSGLSLKHQIHVAQGIGIIDSDYHGEIAVILANSGDQPYTVHPGDRIAQLMFMPVIQATLGFVESFANTTARGTGGFGSTGKS